MFKIQMCHTLRSTAMTEGLYRRLHCLVRKVKPIRFADRIALQNKSIHLSTCLLHDLLPSRVRHELFQSILNHLKHGGHSVFRVLKPGQRRKAISTYDLFLGTSRVRNSRFSGNFKRLQAVSLAFHVSAFIRSFAPSCRNGYGWLSVPRLIPINT